VLGAQKSPVFGFQNIQSKISRVLSLIFIQAWSRRLRESGGSLSFVWGVESVALARCWLIKQRKVQEHKP